MADHNKTGSITVVGIDLAKNVFHLHGIDASSNVVVRKKMSRTKLATFMAKLPETGRASGRAEGE